MYDRRTSGILLHPTALPSPGGIGDLGGAAFRFVDWLAEAKQRRWQLVQDGILHQSALESPPDFPANRVDFGPVIDWKMSVLQRAFAQFSATAPDDQRAAFELFCGDQAHWLDTYALFAAVKEAHNGAPWNEWDRAIAQRQPQAISEWRAKLAGRVRFQQFLQWLFFEQWDDLKRYANGRDIQIIGDIPIFVAYDSADVWANPDVFYLDADGSPTVIAGVPPDYFSRTGQRWGNPLYRWDVLAKRGYDWWVERFRMTLAMVDIVRIDHFRGFAAYWEVPAAEATAINGRWVPGPGAALFEAVQEQLGRFPIIAEDLGLITADVEALRGGLGFPGMAVLQFAWGGDAASIYLPHNHTRNLLVYTGTHDNDTTRGWWRALDEHTRSHVQQYLGVCGDDIAWDFIRAVLMSVADTAIIPMQDVLSLGTEARINLPGRAMRNWGWRLLPDQLNSALAQRLGQLTSLCGRERLAVDEHRDMI